LKGGDLPALPSPFSFSLIIGLLFSLDKCFYLGKTILKVSILFLEFLDALPK
jgi:hypothetical protein